MTTLTNIAEFDNDRTTLLMKFTFFSNFANFFGFIGFFFTWGIVQQDSTNTALMWVFFIAAMICILLAIGGVFLHTYLYKNAADRKRQLAARVAGQNQLLKQYGVPVPYYAITELMKIYINNKRRPTVAPLARFDSKQSDGHPGSYALRMNANGFIEMFSTVGVNWVPVPAVDLTV